MTSEFKVVTQAFVNITIITDTNPYGVEKRYAKDVFISDLKNKLEMITGFSATDMKLKILNKDKKFVVDIDDSEKMLGFYPIEDGYYLQVEASQSIVGSEDPNFKRYELTKEEYEKRRGTVREFKERNKLGQFSEKVDESLKKKEEAQKEKLEQEKKLIENIKVGNRCQINTPGQTERLGTVMYVGEIKEKVGYYVGIKYDEPVGKNDGTINGKRYFECQNNYGGFVKPEYVVIGDFPEETFDEI